MDGVTAFVRNTSDISELWISTNDPESWNIWFIVEARPGTGEFLGCRQLWQWGRWERPRSSEGGASFFVTEPTAVRTCLSSWVPRLDRRG